MHDSLTGVPNRSLLEDRIRQSIARHQREPSPFALLFIDLDDFKKINDWLGHDAGDEVLKHIAARLLANTRPMDTVARLGGDEFVVLLQGVAALDQAAQVGSKLIKAIDEPMVLQGETCRVGASIGVSLYPADASDWQTLMSRADSAMYRAKRAGGNRLDNNGDPLTQPAPL
jgi:diguanylate cyclase (GGDEF)-like protein